MRTLRNAAVIVLGGLTVTAGAWAQANDRPFEPRFLLTQKEAVMVMPPRLVAEPQVTRVVYSPDSRYALVQREAFRGSPAEMTASITGHGMPEMEVSLVLWVTRTQQARTLWRGEVSQTRRSVVQQIAWLPGSAAAYVLLRTSQGEPEGSQTVSSELLLVDAAQGRAAQVLQGEEAENVRDLTVSPKLPLAVLRGYRMKPGAGPQAPLAVESWLQVLGPSGPAGGRTALAEGKRADEVRYLSDGRPAVLVAEKRESGQWNLLDAATGSLSPLSAKPELYTEEEKAPPAAGLKVRAAGATVREGTTAQDVSVLWLETDEKGESARTLLSSDASQGRVVPPGDTVLYQSQGALWAAPLVRMPRAVYEAGYAAAKRATILNQGKQVALALIRYAQDHGDELPVGDLSIASKLQPYLANTGFFDGLNYTYTGGKMSGITDPATTELGYVNCPLGRAIIFADGHVMWRSSTEPSPQQ